MKHPPVGYHNKYKCPRCKHKWEDDWDSGCDDDCPECGNRHVSPYESEMTEDHPDYGKDYLPIVVSLRTEPSCGRECDPAQEPEHWVDIEFTDEYEAALADAKAAVIGESNDAKHGALVALLQAHHLEIPDCTCDGRRLDHLDGCPQKAWEAKS